MPCTIDDPATVCEKRNITVRRTVRFLGQGAYEIILVVGTQIGQDLLGWLDLNEPFIPEAPNYFGPVPPFYVHIPSLLFLGRVPIGNNAVLEHETEPEVRAYFETVARPQFGRHLFVHRYGRVASVRMYLNEMQVWGEVEVDEEIVWGWQYGSHAPLWSGSTPFHAIYPVVRRERYDAIPSQSNETDHLMNAYDYNLLTVPVTFRHSLTLGLWFRHYEDIYNHQGIVQNNPAYREGDRCYNRYSRRWDGSVRDGRVYEITEMGSFFCEHTTAFVLYVCAGAKLVVVDQYQLNVLDVQNHNRSFIQQGGIAVVEDELFLTIPWVKNDRHGMHPRYYTVNDAFASNILMRRNGQPVPLLNNPVIFLGANESEHNSIAWNLSIRRAYSSREQKAVLEIPEGGYIVAIEEWGPGMREILARHQYERLYEPIVRMEDDRYSTVPFGVPDQNADQLLDKILGVGADRSVECHIENALDAHRYQNTIDTLRNREEFPRRYNTRKFEVRDQGNAYRPPVEPMWPAIKLGVGHCYWFPSTGVQPPVSAPLADHDMKIVGKYLIQTKGNDVFYYGISDQKEEYDAHEMQLALNQNVDPDGQNSYLGIDCKIYEKKQALNVIGKYSFLYYRLVKINNNWEPNV